MCKVYSEYTVFVLGCVAWGVVCSLLSGMCQTECFYVSPNVFSVLVFKVRTSCRPFEWLSCVRLYGLGVCYRDGGVTLRVPEDCAVLKSLVPEEGKKHRLEECCVYASIGIATVVQNLWDRLEPSGSTGRWLLTCRGMLL